MLVTVVGAVTCVSAYERVDLGLTGVVRTALATGMARRCSRCPSGGMPGCKGPPQAQQDQAGQHQQDAEWGVAEGPHLRPAEPARTGCRSLRCKSAVDAIRGHTDRIDPARGLSFCCLTTYRGGSLVLSGTLVA